MSSALVFYGALLGEIKNRMRQAQVISIFSVNTEMVEMYWDSGHTIHQRQQQEDWGTGVISRLARDIRNELPAVKGFSERNIKRMLQLYCEHQDVSPKAPQPVAQLPDSDLSANLLFFYSHSLGTQCLAHGKNPKATRLPEHFEHPGFMLHCLKEEIR